MSYSEVFGGATLYPSGQTYLFLQFSTDQVLQWPIEQAVAGDNVASSIMDIDGTAPGLNVDFPDARQVSQGIQTVFNNIGSQTVSIRDATGATILSSSPGTAWVTYLYDNTTEAGSWRTFQLGASISVADAGALAGAGLKAIGSTLNQRVAPSSTAASPITWDDGDRAQLTIWTGGAGILNLPDPAVVGSDWFAMVRNGGSGSLTITPSSGDVDDAATLVMDAGQSATLVTDGTNFFTVGLGQSTAGFFDFVEINVAGSGDFTLSGVQLNRISYRFIGALTGDRNIVVPNSVQQYWVDNSTTGAFSLFVNTVAQVTPVEILQDQRNILYCDGTDVLAAESSSFTAPLVIGQGGTSATDAATALSNLGGVSTARLLNTLALSGLAGGGDLTADRNFELDIDNLTDETTIDFVNDKLAFYDDDAGAMRKTSMENISGLTIEEEGAPLATLADTLNFVGGFVTASGAGATKTITIGAPLILLDNEQIQFGNATDYTLEFDGTFLKFQTTTAGANAMVQESTQNQTIEFWQYNTNGGVGLQSLVTTGDGELVEVDAGGFLGANTYINMIKSTGQCLMNYANVPVLRTAPVSGAAYPYSGTSGGALLNNNTTGSGSNERITTYVDHMMTGGLQDDRSLTNTMANDNRLLSGLVCRQGYWKFEIMAYFRDVGGTSNVEFDFDGDANISECNYIYDYRTADGAPSGNGASDDKTTDQLINLGSASEETMIRISGRFRMSATGTFRFRWRPTVNQIDTVSRMRGSWMTVCPIEIGV